MIEQKKDARSIFLEIVEKAPHEKWAESLKEACGEDELLRGEVQRLLNAHELIGGFMDRPAVDAFTIGSPIAESPGTVFGPYKLLQQIGEGGMGVVFMAEQSEPIQRIVALKIIKPGMDTRQVIARFEAERQALALMDHPNIAKVHDAGTTDWGKPYFVMELVKGVTITKYCDDKRLSLRERLELFLPVCQAVQHAHQKGIIHRDIKPTNVLVAEYDNRAVPKVIDFGVAKATAQRLTERTMFTEFGQVIGTVEYMSPEQAKFNQFDIDTRSDTYSLGVLLYELLTGSTPFEQKRLREAAFEEVLRIIREEEPPLPSTKISSSDALPSIAANRHTEPGRLTKDIRGELDWIVMKSLDKERNCRYQSSSALADDLQNYLTDQPVHARSPSRGYLLRKFLRRHKKKWLISAVSLAPIVAVLLLAYQVRHTRALRSDALLAGLRNEESQIVNKVIAGTSLTDTEKEQAHACISRLDERVANGRGSDVDHELMARLLARHVEINGQAIQIIGMPSLTLSVNQGGDEFNVNGVGVVLSATVAIDGISVRLPGMPVYCSGKSRPGSSTGYTSRMQFAADDASAGFYDISCVLEAQLVQPEHSITIASGYHLTDYQRIGRQVQIAMRPQGRLFVRKLPEGSPAEIRDSQIMEYLVGHLRVSDVIVFDDDTKARMGTLSVDLPNLSPRMPYALEVHIATKSEPLLHRAIGIIFRDEHDNLGAQGGESHTLSALSKTHDRCELTFRLPIPDQDMAQLLSGGIPIEVTLRSSREAARSGGLDYFLSVPETTKLALISVDTKKALRTNGAPRKSDERNHK